MARELGGNIFDDLLCPITQDWLDVTDGPICTPCCGRAFNRSSLLLSKQINYGIFYCPICRVDIDNFDIENAPKNINLANIIETVRKTKVIEKIDPKNIIWLAKAFTYDDDDEYNSETVGAIIEISSSFSACDKKTLLIPVIDKSGSMSGSPMNQVNYSVDRFIQTTKQSKKLITELVLYNDSYNIVHTNNKQLIVAEGGTSFVSAFKGVMEIINKYKMNENIMDIIIVFLTDGQDGSGVSKEKIVKDAKNDIINIWKKPFTVHTIGFGSSYDKVFLENLSKIGTIEGANRNADPNENTDSLSAKINSIFNNVSESNITANIELVLCDKNTIVFNNRVNDLKKKDETSVLGSCIYYIDKIDLNQNNSIKIKFFDNIIEIPLVLATDENTKDGLILKQKYWLDWLSYLINDIAFEVPILIKEKLELVSTRLHIGLILQKAKYIFYELSLCDIDIDNNNESMRLQKLIDVVNDFVKGNVIDEKKVIDMKYEGKFKTKTDQPINVTNKSNSAITNNVIINNIVKKQYIKYNMRLTSRLQSNIDIFVNMSTMSATNYNTFLTSTPESILRTDSIGNNVLQYAASIGNLNAIIEILKINSTNDYINHINNYNETALDLAALNGFWKSYALLLNSNCKHNIDNDTLLFTNICLADRRIETTKSLIKNNIGRITLNLIKQAPNEIYDFLMRQKHYSDDSNDSNSNSNSDIDSKLLLSIEKSNYELVLSSLYSVLEIDPTYKLSLFKCRHLFQTNHLNNIKIVQLLIEKGVSDPNEIHVYKPDIIDNNNDNGKEELKQFNPLWLSSCFGRIQMIQMLLKYVKNINLQNLLGVTALWIACCNGHYDVVIELITNGADVNLPNFKGDAPLVPACQKGYANIVELLLETGANLLTFNKNRDHPVLICCRTGQNTCLNVILKSIKDKLLLNNIIEEKADIDGFNSLLAAAEQNRVECIKVLHVFGANLEYKTDITNNIIGGATPLHIACYYNRFAAVKTLVELGSNVNLQTTVDLLTPLHIAIKGNYLEIVKYLLKLGADKTIVDISGKDPLYYANVELIKEFFTEPLAEPLINCIKMKYIKDIKDVNDTDKCINVLINYGLPFFKILCSFDCINGQCPLILCLQNNNDKVADFFIKADKYGDGVSKQCNNGFTPAFWAHMLQSKYMNVLILSEKDKMYLDNIDKYRSMNIHNKMLLNISNITNITNDSSNNNSNIIDKMNQGFDLDVSDETLRDIELNYLREQSLLAFLKNYDKTQLYIDTKIHLTKMISVFTDHIITPTQIIALYLWTYSPIIYNMVNETLQNWSTKRPPIAEAYILTLYKAIITMPPYIGEVYKCVNTNFDNKKYNIGNIINWNSFVNASNDWKHTSNHITNKLGIVFIIQSKTGRNISRYSKNPQDGEIVFLPRRQFKIKSLLKGNLICMGQANIRYTSYMATETDLEKAALGKLSLIIEIEEL